MQVKDKLTNINLFHRYGRCYLKLNSSQLKAASDFNQKVLNDKVPFVGVSCLCGNDEFSLLASIDSYGLIQSTVICKRCGLIQSNPRMTAEYYRFFYESNEYQKIYYGDRFISDFERFYTDGRGDSIFQTIIKHKKLAEIKSVLEFGAGGGWNLIPFIRQRVSARGYDLSKKLIDLGNKKGIALVCGDINDIKGEYDVIIANHIVEHLTDFLSDIKKLKSHLTDAGIIYIAVPDIQKFDMAHLQNAHTYYFTLKTLHYFMGKCGLKMIDHQPEPGSRMSAIFVVDEPQTDDKFLEGHYQVMAGMLKRYSRLYYLRRFFAKILELLRLKKTTKRIISHFFNIESD